ncbi:hypothetical protein KIN20_030043 [Parelaphostrongylus tenuis]|uniref:Uncharacterized protein n=1 Tax=Parelaphostrongylus tenuis TaxID=148309 RepID=A0AAD5WG17_PARTN|nr:hypothetical protein KIN20_030043 [Parelaphostrongylus tenuis]
MNADFEQYNLNANNRDVMSLPATQLWPSNAATTFRDLLDSKIGSEPPRRHRTDTPRKIPSNGSPTQTRTRRLVMKQSKRKLAIFLGLHSVNISNISILHNIDD